MALNFNKKVTFLLSTQKTSISSQQATNNNKTVRWRIKLLSIET